MNYKRILFKQEVFGADIDAQTRCRHWHSPIDVIAIKFKCCGKYYSCFDCHAEFEIHQPQVWAVSEFETRAVLCGVCGYQLKIDEYLGCRSVCPCCESGFNPGCAKHYHLYFETSAKKK